MKIGKRVQKRRGCLLCHEHITSSTPPLPQNLSWRREMRGSIIWKSGVSCGVSRVSTCRHALPFFVLLLLPICISIFSDAEGRWHIGSVPGSETFHRRTVHIQVFSAYRQVTHSFRPECSYHYNSITLYHFILLLNTAATRYRCSHESMESLSHWINEIIA